MKITSAEFLKSVGSLADLPREGLPEIAFAGRSNVGKSSTINRLLNQRGLAKVSKTPGRTRTINFFKINGAFYFVDLPGYGYAALPLEVRQGWGPLIEGYLTSRRELKATVLILDARHGPGVGDRELKAFLDHHRVPAIVVLTKVDKLPRGRWRDQARLVWGLLQVAPEDVLLFSAATGEGAKELLAAIGSHLSPPSVLL
ncbi:MAG: YihA family ribosome biogenesis GTP-binding protein [candidate division NC10 bacterium]|nr:YihA family ribosome biogenesis GTP-binding protein [candidate division NC10 bacterium]